MNPLTMPDRQQSSPMNNPVVQELLELDDYREGNWCIPQDEARLLYLLARLHQSKSILEVGTSIGFSTLHLALATSQVNGLVTTIDASAERQQIAKGYLEKAGLLQSVCFIQNDALTAITALQKQDAHFDLMFLDARKSEYLAYWEAAKTLLGVDGLLVADNTTSHQDAMEDFIEAITDSPDWMSIQLETPNGLIVAQKMC
jgi:predicted O-methyltransferase YrrM